MATWNDRSDIDLDDLRTRVRGELLVPDSDGYDAARAIWNARYDRRPAAIVRCRGHADVTAGVRFAREQELPLAVRGGGHDYAGHSVCEGGLVLDLSPMKGIQIDPAARRARVQGGVTWGELDHEAQAVGLATTGGTVSSVGVAGYTLGGGSGYLARKHGLAVDNLVAADVVLASGELVRASESENADLFWALRGGGGNFGVVTTFEYRLHEVGPEVLAGQVVHPFAAARDVLALYRSYMDEAPDEVTCYPFFIKLPPIPAFPENLHGQPAVSLVMAHVGTLEAGKEALRPLREFGDPILPAVQPMPYTAAQQMFDEGMPKGNRCCSRAQYFTEISSDAMDTLLEYAEELEGPFTAAYFEPMGGAINRVAPDATAFPHRNAAFGFHVLSGWTDPTEDERMVSWTQEFHDAMAEHASGGVYVNLLSDDEEDRIEEAYADNYSRLARIKGKYDPDNLFRLNRNIEPAG